MAKAQKFSVQRQHLKLHGEQTLKLRTKHSRNNVLLRQIEEEKKKEKWKSEKDKTFTYLKGLI